MTKKDYELLARAIYGSAIVRASETSSHPVAELEGAKEQFALTSRAIADALAQQNPRFNRVRFLDACDNTGALSVHGPNFYPYNQKSTLSY